MKAFSLFIYLESLSYVAFLSMNFFLKSFFHCYFSDELKEKKNPHKTDAEDSGNLCEEAASKLYFIYWKAIILDPNANQSFS